MPASFFPFVCILSLFLFASCITFSIDATNDHHHDDTELHHNCIHDTKIMDMLRAEDAKFPDGKRPIYHHEQEEEEEEEEEEEKKSKRSGKIQAVGPIRIVLRTDSLYQPSKYCASSTGTAPDQLGGTAACSADTVLTEDKRNILTQKLLPAAFNIITSALSVNTVTAPIKVPSTVCQLFDRAPADGDVGVSGADFVLYVSGAPTDGGSTTSSTVGWAAACMNNAEGRPVVGRANFSPKFLVWNDPDPKKKNQALIRAVVHEMFHALGFSEYLLLKTPSISDITIRNKPTKWVTTPKTIARYRAWSGCSSIGGVELEDQGGAGSAISHWERRNLADSIMVAAAGGIMVVDEMTLAVFEDSGFYFPNYQVAEPMTWGQGAGCSFLTNTCGTSSPQMGTYWCQSKAQDTCTFDLRGYGTCSVIEYASPIPETYFQYFPEDPKKGGRSQDFMDYCSAVVPYANARCNSPTLVPDASGIQRGEVFGFNGRCVTVDALALANVVPSTAWSDTRCVLMRCPGGSRLQLQLYTGDWLDCPSTGVEGWVNAPSGYRGRIFCPAAAKVCNAELYIDPSQATNAPVPPSNSPSPSASSSPSSSTSPPTPPPSTTTTAAPNPPTAALVVTVLAVVDPYNETYYKNLVGKITNAGTAEMTVVKVSATQIRVEFSGTNAALYTNRLVTAPTSQLQASGFSSATATQSSSSVAPAPNPSTSDGSNSLSWLPFPLYIFLAIVGGAVLILAIIICCCCIQWRRRRNLNAENGNQNLAKQYREWQDEGDDKGENVTSKKSTKNNNTDGEISTEMKSTSKNVNSKSFSYDEDDDDNVPLVPTPPRGGGGPVGLNNKKPSAAIGTNINSNNTNTKLPSPAVTVGSTAPKRKTIAVVPKANNNNNEMSSNNNAVQQIPQKARTSSTASKIIV